MDITILKKLGLSDKEMTIYLKLLEGGPISVRRLAEKAKLNRGIVYEVLKTLQEKGLASYYNDTTKQKFVAENPEKLRRLADIEVDRVKNLQNNINSLILELKSIRGQADNQPVTKLYEEDAGLRTILNDLLDTLKDKEEKEYYVYSAKDSSSDIGRAFPGFNKERKKRNIYVKAISLADGGGTHGLDERRWLGTNDCSATFIIIYAGKCAFISRDKQGSPVGVLIENQMIYNTQKTIFLNLWKRLA
ncbi:MAG TPA: helix-turn-helix domain-containing protein [bacterium]|nr:MAG: Sugar-specific transcriptional regulator TrmB [Parcubacteria group bacterium ADurb.Bin115]HNU81777.1 helix-turn-helix domain-containing protein [bacterium]HOD87350.1 helix-turn-helix domain-containing protein [bacterium]HQB76466.1 helix-turn-helix domain-containing protein [bacterium]